MQDQRKGRAVKFRKVTAAITGLAVTVGAGLGAVVVAGDASAAATFRDAAYGISASGAAPIAATPAVSSTDGTVETASGSAKSSDGTIAIGSATVRAGGGKASAQISEFTALGGLVAGTVSVSCDSGTVSGTVNGTPAGKVGRNGTVAHKIVSKNADGSTTIIGMRVTTSAATINIGSATCAPATGPGPGPSGTPTANPPGSPTPTPTPTKPGQPPAPKPYPKDGHLPVTG